MLEMMDELDQESLISNVIKYVLLFLSSQTELHVHFIYFTRMLLELL